MSAQSSPVRIVTVLVFIAMAGRAAALAQTATGGVVIPPAATSLEGKPTVQVDATSEGARRRALAGAESAQRSLKITVVNGRYYWASRDNQLLTLSTAGDFTYLSTDRPGQYIRLRKVGEKLSYVEHVDQDTESVTYWGELRVVLGK